MIEYYHPSSDKTVKIEPSVAAGGVSTVVETNANGDVQTLSLREEEVGHFIQALTNGGWLPRQLL